MTVDLTVAPADLSSTCRRQIAQITGSATYLAGGEAVDPGEFRMGQVFIILGGITNGTTYLIASFDAATSKLIWFDISTGAQVSNGDLSAYAGRVEVIGV